MTLKAWGITVRSRSGCVVYLLFLKKSAANFNELLSEFQQTKAGLSRKQYWSLPNKQTQNISSTHRGKLLWLYNGNVIASLRGSNLRFFSKHRLSTDNNSQISSRRFK